MARIPISLKLEIPKSFQKKVKAEIEKAIDKTSNRFVKIFDGKVQLIAKEFTLLINAAPVVSYITGAGRGALGTKNPEARLNEMYTEIITGAESNVKKGKKKKEVFMQIGKLSSLREATTFAWTNSTGGAQIVNLYGLIEDGLIPDTGWKNWGIPGFKYLNKSDLAAQFGGNVNLGSFSRTGEGLMISINRLGGTGYSLPLRHIKGFSRFITSKKKEMLDIVNKYIRISLQQAGFTLK